MNRDVFCVGRRRWQWLFVLVATSAMFDRGVSLHPRFDRALVAVHFRVGFISMQGVVDSIGDARVRLRWSFECLRNVDAVRLRDQAIFSG